MKITCKACGKEFDAVPVPQTQSGTSVASDNSQYFAVNTKKTGTNEDLNNYTHLLTAPEKFINYKKNNEVEGFEC